MTILKIKTSENAYEEASGREEQIFMEAIKDPEIRERIISILTGP